MDETLNNSDLVRGSIDTIILSVLLTGDNYGYQIIKEIYRKSQNRFELKEPTLYSSLRRLEKQKMIESYWGEETQGGRRKYYSITELGRELYRTNCAEWELARNLIDRLIRVEKDVEER
ncbi:MULTISPECIES: PadR family transcriptional regulator [Brevibacillus]|uniref:PadR family transcriptional regulator n=1 Tax=Brevibacillus TaxID=55080 RepID=UPI00148FA743|nr:PadR family transcriptional regulator [Brevibacillus borstelensis]MCC0563984.1 PadR family transcriptional regulator [Brevibacillus borstelensis]MCM3470285.1 PadR family transcriptional regulator [Brevibacillus borstelensis]MCM3558125.1 PadR family transcriptional regulator [Brevibacillus borstelensis]MCM3593890.1 PadR family transcriptional regulator [Brevibacillus borstelensis]MCM3621128.1 PadR family transcriptional regulator [Brevibacillus borstelensis]